ncbi:MAG: hypothetical protein HRU72_10890 [Planctomycetia bacterium]|jgi:hypothetical protein|uniref:Uncharacterized protein n=1 Tax=Candidatus Brocadia sapporoensis TaxID=392547 RepID=A0A1V6LY17_9BACT|nr:hypothetical protein [Candidatus Brocadia sapporoensis]MCC7239550.1 hypothetical protein [Candidatus Brocadia sp.]MEB2307821.1 hypothetical protein [Candidatus Brocadiaceae bacterium]OQZ03616.1 MAG: hypothetical protein B6D34_06755 [Candidatus Brocadia sp. UTAMX1]QOJ07010.1 MAG: hypothetical protein HRU72_10890 [Planctomycetia bacterium]RZV58357.1 MAG: hypothetical protein EX330_06290 [Candidatus Brocadia sp. BROELEC01]TVL95574.1 MAG: hypothetical protein CV082_10305 [Candidatus Brocadia s
MQKEIEKQKPVLRHNWYKTEKELEVTLTYNREILDKLLREYAGEVDKVNKKRYVNERIIRPGSAKHQGFDATLKMNFFSPSREKWNFAESKVDVYKIK